MHFNSDNIDSITKILASLLTLLGIIVGLWQYNNGQRNGDRLTCKQTDQLKSLTIKVVVEDSENASAYCPVKIIITGQ